MSKETSIAHYNEFEKMAQKFGIENIKTVVLRMVANEDVIKLAIANGDDYLNSIKLILWDFAAITNHPPTGWQKEGYAETIFGNSPSAFLARPGNLFYGKGLSLSDRICMLKHVAKYYIGGAPKPI